MITFCTAVLNVILFICYPFMYVNGSIKEEKLSLVFIPMFILYIPCAIIIFIVTLFLDILCMSTGHAEEWGKQATCIIAGGHKNGH